MTVAIGKFGPYIRHDSAFYSLPKEVDPHSVEESQAIQIIEDKRKKDAEKLIKTFEENPDVKIENGRWGPYIKFGKQNIKIPKGKEPENVTYAEILALSETADKPARKTGGESKKTGGRKFARKK